MSWLVGLRCPRINLFGRAEPKRQLVKYGPRRCRGCAGGKVATGDMVLAPQRLCRPWRHPYNKGEREAWWSHHCIWSNISGRDRPGQKSYPQSSLDLLQRPPYACESWCQLVRLPPSQDGTVEHFVPGLLNAELSLSSSPLDFLSDLSKSSSIIRYRSAIVG